MFITYNTNTGLFGAYATRKEADGGTGMPVYASVEELAQTKASLTEMAKFYNRLTGSDIKKFSDKNAAARRIWDAAVAANEEFNEQNKADEGAPDATQPQPDATQPQPDAPEAADEQTQQEEGNSQTEEKSQPVDAPAPKRGRKPGTGQFAGKTVFAKKQVNPRRAGTKGWHSYNIFLGKPEGVPYADYIAAGGRAVDLDWDIKHKFAEVK